jgi:hypothetical protein
MSGIRIFSTRKFQKQTKEFVDNELLYMGAGLKPGEEAPNGK